MANIEKDSFENYVKPYGSFHKSTMLQISMKKKKELNKTTTQLIFGINRKQDNQNKTKQLKLF
jgi:hypothetical protein